jgi:hypothetical protein
MPRVFPLDLLQDSRAAEMNIFGGPAFFVLRFFVEFFILKLVGCSPIDKQEH